VGYPLAIDNDYKIWRAFDNQVWPALYFFDAEGHMRHHVFGEGSYKQSERLIQELLSEVNGASVSLDVAPIVGEGPQAAADEKDLRSPETYVGYNQATNFASPSGMKEDVSSLYSPSAVLPLNHWSLTGIWTIGSEFATLSGTSGSVAYRFHARDLHLVLGSSVKDQPVRFRISIDGKPPGADHGSDVNAEGWGELQEQRLYQMVRQTGSIADRTFEIEFFDSGVHAYAFTFG